MDINGASLFEASIANIQGAQFTGQVTARQVLEAYRGRIAAFDQQGPTLNAMVVENPEADAEADRLDEIRRQGGRAGPLHGIPVVVKDNLETVGMPTSFGSEIFKDYRPTKDATVVAKLRAAGAIIVGKTAMPDWASAWFAQSSRSGATKNPYALEREPGGSSSGTAAGVAAGYAAIGLGTDTGGSVRLPASFCNLVGARSTPGLISRAGCSPLVSMQDTIGPLGRSVTDVARVFDVLVGFDDRDPLTFAYSIARAPKSYLEALRPNALNGLRLGVLRTAFGADGEETTPVNRIMADALAQCVAGGAELVDVEVGGLAEWSARTSFYDLASRFDMDTWLAELERAPMTTVAEIVASGRYHTNLKLLEDIAEGPQNPAESLSYHKARAAREAFMQVIVTAMETHHVEALVYPTCQALPPSPTDTGQERWSTVRYLTPLVISSQTWLPAISVPAGFSAEGLPVGLEILTRPYDEPTMFQIAYGFEEVASHRRVPPSTPLP